MRFGFVISLLLCMNCLSTVYAAVPPPYISYANEENLQFESQHCKNAVKTALNKDGFQRITVSRQHIFGAYRRSADYRYKTIVSCFAKQGLIQVIVVTEMPNSALKKARKLLADILQQPHIQTTQETTSSSTLQPASPVTTPPQTVTTPVEPQIENTQQKATHHYLIGNAHFVNKDYERALESYRIAAAHGEPHAQYQLGRLYYEGLGVNQDFVQAYTWWLLAEARGYPNAKRARDTVIHYLNAEQIAQGQENARLMLEQLPMR